MGEAKGWIRGKYAVDAALLDQILRLFPATAFQASTIKGPQLLAVLCLISHAQAGLGVDRSLVFSQATKPLGSDIQTPNVIPLASPLPPPPSRSSPYPKPPPPIRQGSSYTAPPDGASTSGGRRISSEDTASRTSLSSNPFRRSLSQNPGGIGGSHAGSTSYARSHSAAGADDESSDGGRRSPTYSAPAISRTSRPPSVTRSTSRKGATLDEVPFPNNNPFFRPPDSTAVTLPVTLPPLPPRKPPSQATAPLPPPPSHAPIQPPPRHPAPPPPKPARKPSHTHSTSTSNLIRQSLVAAKTAPKAPEGTLASAMKSLVIVKSSSSNHPPSGSGSGGTLKDRVRGEKEKSSDSSAATTTAFSQSGRSAVTSSSTPTSSASASSMEYVAAARVQPPLKPLIRSTTTTISTTAATAPHSRSASPSKLSPTKLSMAEAQDIVQISASSSSTSMSNSSSTDLASMNRPVRSKSLHGTASSGSMKGPVPTPPPRRRPESVQVTGSPFVNAPTSAPSATTASSSPFNLSRRSSIQHPPPRANHSPSPSRSASTAIRSPSGATTPPSLDPFSSFYSTVKQHLAPKPAAESVNANIFQPAAAELHKIGTKLEGGLAPGRGYISHRGLEGERLVKKGQQDDGDDDDGYRRLSAYSDAPTVDSDTPGMDTNPPEPSPTGTRLSNTESWMNWDPTPGPRPMPSRGASDATITSRSKPASPTYSTTSARSSSGQQRRDVQQELDKLRAQSRDGWGRLV
ncbi:hypothetical protein M407DRAFT_17977 [Tulasnella calospora MUT 4182]|uniref:Uncharacterized protein n=1 Tax=Tulasnella calospora MUT 4182 TaxID=1051891 RepID=A0A0C3MHC5_9AGAM|nr:hypothetical protein M407DRAFT_17977 [Tulasnella calospora MUT 4182]